MDISMASQRLNFVFCCRFIYIFLILTTICCGVGAYDRDDCLINPHNPGSRFRLLDPKDGIPLVNINGFLRKSPTILNPIPDYHFTRSQTDHDAFDLRQGNHYVAVFSSGKLGFVEQSSHGSQPVGRDGEEYITTIFTISCFGTIGLRLQDSVKYSFGYHTRNHSIMARPSEPQKLIRRWNPALHLFHKRAEEGFDHIGDSWEPFTFLAGPLRVSDHYQIGYAPRCPATPFGLQSFLKTDARATGFNGCGADNGMKFPDFRFTICCNNHDLCYDDCGMVWEDCNDNFRKCMHQACADNYKDRPANSSVPASNTSTWSQWGCDGLAETYADAVGTRIGAWSFNIATKERCDCGCPTGTMNCTDMCLRDCKERCDIVGCSAESKTTSTSTKTTSSSSTSTVAKTSSTSTSTSSTTLKTTSTTSTTTGASTESTALPSPSANTTSAGGSWWWPFGS